MRLVILTKFGRSVWSVILQSKFVILQGTLVGHLKLVMLKSLNVRPASIITIKILALSITELASAFNYFQITVPTFDSPSSIFNRPSSVKKAQRVSCKKLHYSAKNNVFLIAGDITKQNNL